eukprot:1302099-Pyramimonas_sp.AAC.1
MGQVGLMGTDRRFESERSCTTCHARTGSENLPRVGQPTRGCFPRKNRPPIPSTVNHIGIRILAERAGRD